MIFCPHYYKPIVSMYAGFNSRDLIKECCICEKRIHSKVTVNFSTPFPIPTNSISYTDFNLILNNIPFERLGSIVYVKDIYK